jgi:hypothetical protein
MSKLIRELVTNKPLSIILEQKILEENVGTHLLQRFDEESEDEEHPITTQAVLTALAIAPVVKGDDKGKKTWGAVQATRMSSRMGNLLLRRHMS